MSKPKQSRPSVSSQKDDDNYNLEFKKQKVKAMGASRLIMRMYGEEVSDDE